MNKPLRTNPAYAALAYEKTITRFLAVSLRRKFLGDELTGPKETLICEEVFPVDAKIPPEAIQQYIEQLNDREAQLDVQLRKFELTTRESNAQSKDQKRAGRQEQKGGQGHRKAFRPT